MFPEALQATEQQAHKTIRRALGFSSATAGTTSPATWTCRRWSSPPRRLPHVVFASDSLFTCSDAGLAEIRAAVAEHNLNRVVVASCTPRTHEPLFQATCEEAGLNRYLFEFVNIRDQCSWVHMNEPEQATQKAKDLIRMGVAKAALLEPLEETELAVQPAVAVIGGGMAGMTAALSLARRGFRRDADRAGTGPRRDPAPPRQAVSHPRRRPFVGRTPRGRSVRAPAC